MKRQRNIVDRFLDKTQPCPPSDCLLWTAAVDAGGYGVFYAAQGRMRFAHKAAYWLFVGDIPESLLVLHKCDVRCCVNPKHLYLGDHKQNSADMIARGRGVFHSGENHRNAKLTNEQARTIRTRALAGEKALALAKEFGVSERAVYGIAKSEMWRSI